MQLDILTLENDPQSGEALLVPVMRDGRRMQSEPALTQSRARVTEQFARLPRALLRLEKVEPYRVEI